ncbi:MAG: ABC transporter permease [Lentisphaerae bacterium]|jgi:putative ABC transport system permease protein|nr:ABC transporter permease [Lentisphaerota bacterium]MBT4815859.1 ABC transporter permease [Lentisphaerota bacterium]MBT5610877.1 ABC transporter permease [Lentisphaerota bacterium]MBT7053691.1 ABC transporter permease [Lentisphaerota bacterium]MBT7841152.1 ABC transporter permease [Lentisphaerota bacterium]
MRLLPFEYAVRNLTRSKLRLSMSLGGSAIVVLLVVSACAFVRGMEQSLMRSGSPHNVILLGAGSEESVERSEVGASVPGQVAASIPGIRSKLGVPFVSPEAHMALTLATAPDGPSDAQAVFRGVTSSAFLVHPQVRITAGRVFAPGRDEVIIGALAATRLGLPEQDLAVGRRIWVDGREWQIVGRFEAPSTVMDAEIWCPLTSLQILTRRDSLSCVVLTLGDAEFPDVETFAMSRLDLELSALREDDYYGKLVAFYRPIRLMVWVTALLIATGGVLGGLNTMYAAFGARAREVGMLQALGFSRWSVVVSFLQESVLVASAGSLAGVGLALGILDGVAVRVSMGAFGLSVDGLTVAVGIISGVVLGAVGALPPALRCLRLPVTEALKSV